MSRLIKKKTNQLNNLKTQSILSAKLSNKLRNYYKDYYLDGKIQFIKGFDLIKKRKIEQLTKEIKDLKAQTILSEKVKDKLMYDQINRLKYPYPNFIDVF